MAWRSVTVATTSGANTSARSATQTEPAPHELVTIGLSVRWDPSSILRNCEMYT